MFQTIYPCDSIGGWCVQCILAWHGVYCTWSQWWWVVTNVTLSPSVELSVSQLQHSCYSRQYYYNNSTFNMYTRVILYTTLISCWGYGLLSTNIVAASLLLSYLITGGNYTLYLLYHTGFRDARGAWRYLQLLVLVYIYQKRKLTVSKVFQRTVRKHPDKVAMYFEDESWTFKQVTVNTIKRNFPGSGRVGSALCIINVMYSLC